MCRTRIQSLEMGPTYKSGGVISLVSGVRFITPFPGCRFHDHLINVHVSPSDDPNLSFCAFWKNRLVPLCPTHFRPSAQTNFIIYYYYTKLRFVGYHKADFISSSIFSLLISVNTVHSDSQGLDNSRSRQDVCQETRWEGFA